MLFKDVQVYNVGQFGEGASFQGFQHLLTFFLDLNIPLIRIDPDKVPGADTF